eukprot:TRINITY_DN15050_c0_g1_i2.p1 TRINITY_DN15050_c0_g1~~TRINITY_DN15050_c0_g1_i2.p1  ORF type:complete len:1186 (-),score=187.96 TRINITY_DN15050_c0_g1_i2:133-3690(-)
MCRGIIGRRRPWPKRQLPFTGGQTSLHVAVRMRQGIRRRNPTPALQLRINAAVDADAAVISERRQFEWAACDETRFWLVGKLLLKLCDYLLQRLCSHPDVDVNAPNHMGTTALHMTTQRQVALLLLEARANANSKDKFGDSPLHAAARASECQVLTCLVEAKGDVNGVNANGETPLRVVLGTPSPCLAAVEALLCNELDVNSIAEVSSRQTLVHVVLHAAWAAPRRMPLVQKLCRRSDIDVNAEDKKGNTPLHVALNSYGDESYNIVEALLRAGADANARDKTGETPAHVAVRSAVVETRTFQSLLHAGAANLVELLLMVRKQRDIWPIVEVLVADDALEVNRVVVAAERLTLLHVVLQTDFPTESDRVRLLQKICSRVDINANARDYQERSALHIASELYAVILLANARANVNAKDLVCESPLHAAARKSAWQGLAYLVWAMGDVNTENKNGQTPMQVVLNAPQPCLSCVEALLVADLDVNRILNKPSGETLLHMALRATRGAPRRRRTALVKKLCERADIDVNGADVSGCTALHVTLQPDEGDAHDLVVVLVRAKADVNAKDKSGSTPAHLAVRSAVVEPRTFVLLLRAGATNLVELLFLVREQRNIWPIVEVLAADTALDVNQVVLASEKLTLLHVILRTAFPTGSQRWRLLQKLCSRVDLDTNIPDQRGRMPLHLTSQLDEVRLLAEARANVSAKDAIGELPLHVAVRSSAWDVMKYLVEAESDVNVESGNGETPMQLVLNSPNPCCAAAEMLLVSALDVNRVVSATSGQTILHLVLHAPWAVSRREALVRMLCSHTDIDTNAIDAEGLAPLHLALRADVAQSQESESGIHEIVELLLRAGADVGLQNKHGMTPAHLASLRHDVHLRTPLMMLCFARGCAQQELHDGLLVRLNGLEATCADFETKQQRLLYDLRQARDTNKNLERSCAQSSAENVDLLARQKLLQSSELQLQTKNSQQLIRISELENRIASLRRTYSELQASRSMVQAERDQLHLQIQQRARRLSELETLDSFFYVPPSKYEVLQVKPSPQIFGNRREQFFREAESHFLRQLQPSSRLLGKLVSMVEVLFNGSVWQRYSGRRRIHGENCVERWGFHGTDEGSLQSIIRSGFEVGGEGVPIRNGAAAGHGVYLANSPDLSFGFARVSKMIMAQFYVAGARQDRDAWVVACKDDVCPRYIIHF